MSSRDERSDEEDVLELIGVNENQGSNDGSGDELQGDEEQVQEVPVDGEDAENAAKKETPKGPKRRKSQIPRLTANLLKGPKGVHTIEKYFEGFKFHGKGREKEDLDRVMKRLEHWSHRLYPKLNFDDCLSKIETLGSKKELQVFLKKYRLDMITADEDSMRPEFVDDDDDERRGDPDPEEEFDLMLAEQIKKQRQNENAFDNLLASVNPPTAIKEQASGISDEVKERIERNRKLALERKQATLKRLQELKATSIDNQEASTSGINEVQSSTNNVSQPVSDSGIPTVSEENNVERMQEDTDENQKLESENDYSEKHVEESNTFSENSTSQTCDVSSEKIESLNDHNPKSQNENIDDEIKERIEETETNCSKEASDELMTANEIEKPNSELMEEDAADTSMMG